MTEINKSAIINELTSLKKKRDRLSASLQETTSLIGNLQNTLEHFSPKSKKRVPKVEMLKIDPDALRGKSLDDVLVYLAEQNDGIVKNYAVRPLLVDAGILRGKRPEHALSVALRNSERFESVSRGQFKLVDDPNLNGDSLDESEDEDPWLADKEANEEVEVLSDF